MSSFSVIIISYNGKEFLRRCLIALLKSNVKPLQIIVVDDFSSDGTEEMVLSEFSFVEFVRNNKNSGPTASRNRGAQMAKGDYLIFLDNDILVRPSTLKELVGFLENNTKEGVVGAKVIPQDKQRMWWNMGYDPNNFREVAGYLCGFLLKVFPKSRRLKKISIKFILNYWDYDTIMEVGWVVESCFAIRKQIFDKINGFDEQFFMYYEGPDLCLRVRECGYGVYFYPKAEADLLDSHTHNQFNRALFLTKSKYRFFKKHYFYKRSNPILFWIGKAVSGIAYLIA